jgi:hypothetical protein
MNTALQGAGYVDRDRVIDRLRIAAADGRLYPVQCPGRLPRLPAWPARSRPRAACRMTLGAGSCFPAVTEGRRTA